MFWTTFATVQEAVNALRGEPFTIVTVRVPGETRLATSSCRCPKAPTATAPSSQRSAKNRSSIMARKYQVMTNSPIFDEQLA